MKLSEAMMLGASTCKMLAGDWNTCALGAAGNATGITQCVDHEDRERLIYMEWPWLDEVAPYTARAENPLYGGKPTTHAWNVFDRFDMLVCEGLMSYESLVDYVRSVEPACGECNRFECSCVIAPEPAAESVNPPIAARGRG